MKEEFLLPGDYVTARGAAHFRTLLGSCVSVCLSNKKRGVYAMNHYMLPENPGVTECGRFGDTSTQRIIDTLFSLDPQPSNYIARIYGGGAVVGHLGAAGGIGERNIELAQKLLEKNRIRISTAEVGGKSGRKIDFWTDRDVVESRLINPERKAAATGKDPGDALRVVVVDDSQTARAMIRSGLEAAGMNVIGEAANAFEARERVIRLNPDVMTLDLEMPMLDGVSFLKKLTQYLPMPVVVVSSSAPSGSERAREALEAGAQSVVDKADLGMSGRGDNIARVLVPRVKLAALARIGGGRKR